MKIKNRKAVLRQIWVPLGGRIFRPIHVTEKQLARLNGISVGKEVFLSKRYCQIGGGFWVIRTKDGLQYMPNPYRGTEEDFMILGSMLR